MPSGLHATVTPLLPLLGAALYVGALAGCQQTVEGRYVATDSIILLGDVTATDTTGSDLSLRFVVGGDTPLDLVDDEVEAQTEEEQQVLSAQALGRYESRFDASEGDAEFTVALTRTDVRKTSAPETHGQLPSPFSVSFSPEGDVRRSEDLIVRWDPSGDADAVTVELQGSCISDAQALRLTDDGLYTFNAGRLITDGPESAATCEVEAIVTRTRSGEPDEHLSSESRFWLHQRRTANFTSRP